MKKISALLVFLFAISSLDVQAQVKSPSEFLGYELGEHFTPHYKVAEYVKHVAEQSGMVEWHRYGETNERRELLIAAISTEGNIDRMQEIRTNNLKRTGLMQGDPTEDKTAIVWLSYNVHGNETSSSEAAMNTLWEFVRPGNTLTKEWLKDVMVIMDPMVNPDGRDRYVNWYNSVVGNKPNVHQEAREHDEPWPGGRVNHYYFDLNRDWAWQTQVETQQRIKAYHAWMPHIHVDFHEQFFNDNYYFAPAAEPFHKAITDWQREFQTTIGRNHARYFDNNNWLYFTREVFDLFYPSYGDTWPTFNGAIGMTYEQAGHGLAGLGIIKAEGDTLTLRDRFIRHSTTGLSTVEITARNHEQVVDEFTKYFADAQQNPQGKYETYVVSQTNNSDNISSLLSYLRNQQITFSRATSKKTTNGYNYDTGKEERVTVEEGDYLISTYQPQGKLVRVLFEPMPELSDSLTYDITAWELHYAYGLKGYALKDRINGSALERIESTVAGPIAGSELENPYAYIARWNSDKDLKFLTTLLNNDVKVRLSEEAFTMNGKDYEPGTLVILRNNNMNMGSRFDDIVKKAAYDNDRHLDVIGTGFVTSGKDFGSDAIKYIDKPRVALVSGQGTSTNMVGHIWHYFDNVIDYPVTLIDRDNISGLNWSDYDVLIMPSGSYGSALGESGLNDLKSWIRSGGKVIAISGGASFLAGQDGFSLKRKSNPSQDGDDELPSYEDRQRSSISSFNAGSIFEVTLDNSHPLAFGYGDTYHELKLGSATYEFLDNGWNVGVVKENAHRSGFIGYKAKERLQNVLAFGVQNMGAGEVIYMVDNPLFRGFWHNSKLLFGNAVFIVGN